MSTRHKLEATLNQEEERKVQKYCEENKISRYNLVREAVFIMINNNTNLEKF